MIIRVIDFEASALELPDAEVCEVGICDVNSDDLSVAPPDRWFCGVRAMSAEARAVHHITMQDCEWAAPFNAEDVRSSPCDMFAAHNADFELKFFDPDLPMICTYRAALRVWPEAPAHSNGVLRYWLADRGAMECIDPALATPAHRAGPDAYVTGHILAALIAAGTSLADMVAWAAEPPLLPRFPIGKDRGRPWSEIDSGFLNWMLNKKDMDDNLKWNARRELDRRA